MAALIFTAAGLPTWSRDPKRTLLAALCGNVAHEAQTVYDSTAQYRSMYGKYTSVRYTKV